MKKKLKLIRCALKIFGLMLLSIISFISICKISIALYQIMLFMLGAFYMGWMLKTIYKLGEHLCRKDGKFGTDDTTG